MSAVATEPLAPRTWTNPQQLVGTTLDERYALKRVLGAGGMGAVFEAEQVTLRKTVAVKVLDPQLAAKPRHVERFLREARAASKIRNLHVVDITDFGEVPGGSVYYVMELLEGRDLSHAIAAAGRLPWPRVKSILLQVIHALEVAHDHGVVHRDLKPANCIILPHPDEPTRDFVKVVDFGIAKMLESDREGEKLTRPNEIMGTVAYMAPEQVLCRPVDVRTDVYSLGIVAFEMLTGRVPFRGKGAFETLDMHIQMPPPSMRPLAPEVSVALDNVVLRAMQKNPDDRYPDMRAFERAVRSIGDDGERTIADPSEPWAAPTVAREVAQRDSGVGAPSGPTQPAPPNDTDPRAPARSASGITTATGLSMGSMVAIWAVVLIGGLALGAWLFVLLLA